MDDDSPDWITGRHEYDETDCEPKSDGTILAHLQ